MNSRTESMYAKIVFHGKHIAIHHQPIAAGRTDYYAITKNLGGMLGWIRWYASWRQYCFFPCEGTIWSVDCLADVSTFTEKLNTDAAKAAKEG